MPRPPDDGLGEGVKFSLVIVRTPAETINYANEVPYDKIAICTTENILSCKRNRRHIVAKVEKDI